MSRLTRLALKSGPVVLIGIVVLFAAGIIAATQLQQNLLPNISLPGFIVITPDPGASPELVDSEVTVPIDAAVQNISGVNTVISGSEPGVSLVFVEFNQGVDPNAIQQQISSAVQALRGRLPVAAGNTTIETFSTSSIPILEYAAYSKGTLASLTASLQRYAVPRLQAISGVSNVNLTGAPTNEVLVTVNPALALRHHVSVSQVAAAISGSSVVESVGAITQDGESIPVQVYGQLDSIAQITGTVIPVTTAQGGAPGATSSPQAGQPTGPINVGSVATVRLITVPADTITTTNGHASIGISITNSSTSNTVTVANAVKAALPGIEAQMGNGARLQPIVDNAVPITNAINGILQEGLLGAIFAVIVIYAFLRNLRATLVAAISIPLSLLVALVVLWSQGLTLNILTLGGLMVAVGRVVDDAIVVLENTSRHVTEGEEPKLAAYTASREIAGAVTASTLTTVGVFLPIAFMTGIAGEFFAPFALTVVAALVTSLIVALTVVPLLASRFLPTPKKVVEDVANGPLQKRYVPIIKWATSHRGPVVAGAVVFFLASMSLIPTLQINLLDQSSSPDFTVNLKMPANSTLAQTNSQTVRVEQLIRNVPGITGYQATVGGNVDPYAPPGSVPATPTKAKLTLLVKTGAYNAAYAAVGKRIRQYQGPATIQEAAASSSSTASANQYSIQLNGNTPAALAIASVRVEAALAKVPSLSNIQSDLAASKPAYQLSPRPALAHSGLTLATLSALVAQAINGQGAGTANLASGPVAIQVSYPGALIDSGTALGRLPIATAGGIVPLSQLVTVSQVAGPQAIARTNGEESATITANINSNNTAAVQRQVTRELKTVSLPVGVTTSTGGAFQELSTVLEQFLLAILGAIALVYMVMVATFRSFLKPLILLVSIPFAATGAVIALALTGTPLSLPGLIGILMLTGIVVTNAIVLLDLVEQYREHGMELQDALIAGGRRRLRPILMTACATLLALLPLAVSGNSGGGFISAPLAIVVIGGLFTSTILTLILVPVLYSLASRFTGPRQSLALDKAFDEAAARKQQRSLQGETS